MAKLIFRTDDSIGRNPEPRIVPFENSQDLNRWMEENCDACSKFGKCEFARSVIMASVEKDKTIAVQSAIAIGWDARKGFPTRCQEKSKAPPRRKAKNFKIFAKDEPWQNWESQNSR